MQSLPIDISPKKSLAISNNLRPISRICYGVELEPRYIDVAIRRWQNLTGEDALLLGCGMNFNQIERNNER